MTNLTPPLKIDIINLGCSKNLVDSENLLTRLRNGGAEVRLDPERIRADILIINTCGFIHDAREESVNTILQAVEAKKNGRIKEIRVMGCLVQRYQKDLSEIVTADRKEGEQQLTMELLIYTMLDHETHHRGQLSVYLKMIGK